MDKKRYTGVMVKCGDKVLLAKRNSQGAFPGMWSIFGGKLEENETTMEGAKREFFEETAIDIDEKDRYSNELAKRMRRISPNVLLDVLPESRLRSIMDAEKAEVLK